MKVKKPQIFYGILLFAILFSGAAMAQNDYRINLIKRFYSVGTASINGTYYPVGNSIARILSKNIKNLVVLAEPTEGSVANVEYLRKGQIDLALIQSDVAWQSVKGAGSFLDNPFKELKILASLYSEVIQIVVRKSSKIKSIADLKGCRISVGSKESGSAVNAVQVMAAAGLQPDDYELVYERFTKATESLRDGYVDAVYYTGGVPADGLVRLAAKTELRFVEIPLTVQKKLVNEYPYFSSETIPPASYQGQVEKIDTIGLRALLATSEQMSDTDAHRILETIYQNASLIASQNTASIFFRKNEGTKGVADEMLHIGAARFFSDPKAK